MSALWGGRFEGALDPAFDAFNRSLPFDRRLLADDLTGSAAWARALGAAGVLEAGEVERLVTALGELSTELTADDSPISASDAEDVHSFVEGALGAKVGDLAKKLHTGRSRNDQVATDLKLYLRRTVTGLVADVEDLIAALVELAHANAGVPLPGYTHLQRAQPVTAGHHALAYAEMLGRDRSRMLDALGRLDTSPLGCGALAGTAFPVDREALATDLGFGGPARNSLDAVSDRDHAIETVFACATTMLHLSRLAEDWIFFASQEAGFITFTDAVSTGSSLMPQKKNPDAMELIRGKTGRVFGALSALFMTVKALPLAYDKDLQEDKEALFDALDTARACVSVAAICARNVTYHEDRCRAACATGFLNATDLADLLVRAGVPFRDAHERVGVAVRTALELGVELEGLPESERAQLFPELSDNVDEALSVDAVLARRATVGGTSPDRVREEVLAWQRRLESWRK